MTTAQIVSAVQARIRETAPTGDQMYTSAIIVNGANAAQNEMGLLLPVDMLGELVTAQGALTPSGGSASLAGLTVLGSFERAVARVYDATNSKWMRLIKDLGEINNSYTTPTIYDPGYRIASNLIYVYPTTGITSIKVDYMTRPTDMVDGGQAPTINASLHYILQMGAEYYARATVDDKNELTAIARDAYYKEIAALNKKAGA